jgi:hypothetical protein
MLSLPGEIMMLIFEGLDDRSLARAICVCRTWAQLATDVLCTHGPPGEWLRQVNPEQYAPRIQQLTLTRPVDLELDCRFPNVRRLSVAVSLLGDAHRGPLIYTISLCGSPELPLHLHFFNDCGADMPRALTLGRPAAQTGVEKRVSRTAFYFLAARRNLRSLSMDAVLLPPRMKHEKPVTKTQFADLHALRTWVSVQQAQRTLWHVPAVRDLTLIVTNADESGAVLQAVADTLPHLRVLKLVFRRAFSLVPVRDLPLLRRLRALTKLEIRDEADSPPRRTVTKVTPRQWKAFCAGLPGLERIVLPLTLALPHPASMAVTGMCWRHLRRLYLFASWDIQLVHRSRCEILFPQLQSMTIRSVVPPDALQV